MPLTPFHIAYVLPLRMKFKQLDFQALSLGSMVPDFEIPVLAAIGFNPTRLITQSLVGAFTVDIFLAACVAWLLQHFKLSRCGFYGFDTFKFTSRFALSAMLGALAHVAVDALHHEANPVIWPLQPHYIPSLLFEMVGWPWAHLVVNGISLLIIALEFQRLLTKNGQTFRLIFFNPLRAAKILTHSLAS